MRAMGVRAAVLARPGQVCAWPGETAGGEHSVFVTVPHRLLAGCRNTLRPRAVWWAEVDCSAEWLAEYNRAGGFGYMFEVEGVALAEGPEGEELYAYEVIGAGPVSMRLNLEPESHWVGRALHSSAVRGYETDSEGYDEPLVVHEVVGSITGLTRKMGAVVERGQPWATVFELDIGEAMVLGDELQAMGQGVDGQVITFAAMREPMPAELRRVLGLDDEQVYQGP